jgi:hypothetical protein
MGGSSAHSEHNLLKHLHNPFRTASYLGASGPFSTVEKWERQVVWQRIAAIATAERSRPNPTHTLEGP